MELEFEAIGPTGESMSFLSIVFLLMCHCVCVFHGRLVMNRFIHFRTPKITDLLRIQVDTSPIVKKTGKPTGVVTMATNLRSPVSLST